jgi:hypothetical protein
VTEADPERRMTYFLVAKEFPVSVAMDDVTFAEAMAVAGNCVADGQVLVGPDEGPEGYVVNFDLVAGLRVTPKPPLGSSIVMPSALVAQLIEESNDEYELMPDGEGGGSRG